MKGDGVLSDEYHDIRRFSKVTHGGAAGFRMLMPDRVAAEGSEVAQARRRAQLRRRSMKAMESNTSSSICAARRPRPSRWDPHASTCIAASEARMGSEKAGEPWRACPARAASRRSHRTAHLVRVSRNGHPV